MITRTQPHSRLCNQRLVAGVSFGIPIYKSTVKWARRKALQWRIGLIAGHILLGLISLIIAVVMVEVNLTDHLGRWLPFDWFHLVVIGGGIVFTIISFGYVGHASMGKWFLVFSNEKYEKIKGRIPE